MQTGELWVCGPLWGVEYHIQLRANKHQIEARRKSRAAQHREREQKMEFQRDMEDKRRREAGGLLTTKHPTDLE